MWQYEVCGRWSQDERLAETTREGQARAEAVHLTSGSNMTFLWAKCSHERESGWSLLERALQGSGAPEVGGCRVHC